MGEYADMSMEYEVEEELNTEFLYPEWEDLEWTEDDMADMQYDCPSDRADAIKRRKNSRVCKYCGETNLHWEKTKDDKWRLYSKDGVLHACLTEPKELEGENESKTNSRD